MHLFELWFCPDICPGVGLLSHTVILFLLFWWTFILFSIVAAPVYISTSNVGESLISTPSLAFVTFRRFDDGHSGQSEVIPPCSFDLHFSNNEQCWAFFSCAFWLSVCLLWRSFYGQTSSAHISIRLFVLLLSSMSCLYILEIKALSVTSFAHIFSHSVSCLNVLFMISSAWETLIVWLGPICLFSFLFLLPWGTNLRKHWYNLFQSALPIISSRSFMVPCLMVKSLSHFEFIFCVCCEGMFQLHWFTYGCPAFPAPLAEETVSSLLYILAPFVEV